MVDRPIVIVTGGTGFVGTNLVDLLLREGYAVVGITRQPEVVRDARRGVVDWMRWEAITVESFRKAVAVIHLATCYGKTERAAEVFDANLVQPLRLFSQAAEAGVRIFINTDSYFSRAPESYPYLQDYRASKKYFSETARRLVAGHAGACFIDAQLEHPYGPYEPAGKFCAQVFDAFLRGDESFPCTEGLQERDFVHVDDVASAYLALLRGSDHLTGYRRVDVGTGSASTLRSFIEKVRELSGGWTTPCFGALPYREHEIMRSVADVSFLASLGWTPAFNLTAGLRDCLRRRSRHD